MKKSFLFIAVLFFAISASIACRQYSEGDISITISESDNTFTMKSHFDKRKTQDVLAYMDSRIGIRNNFSFKNSRLHATLTLEDQTQMYINTQPGYVEIKMNKSNNSYENYKRVKNMCEGMKEIVK